MIWPVTVDMNRMASDIRSMIFRYSLLHLVRSRKSISRLRKLFERANLPAGHQRRKMTQCQQNAI